MPVRFVLWLVGSAALTIGALAAAGWIVAGTMTEAPREKFMTGAFEFDLAPGWSCELDGTEYVCHEGSAKRKAVAVMAMKRRNAQDSLEAYQKHLEQPQKTAAPAGGTAGLSEIRYVRRRTLGGKEWVESLHLGSEITGYLTYYLGTTTSSIGILVTLSVHKDHADAYVRELNEMMATLIVHER